MAQNNAAQTSGIEALRQTDLENLDTIAKMVRNNGWIRREEADGIASPRANYMASKRSIYMREFKKINRTMPANYLQILSSKLTQLRAAVAQRAGSFAFPNSSHNTAMESFARRWLTSRYRGV